MIGLGTSNAPPRRSQLSSHFWRVWQARLDSPRAHICGLKNRNSRVLTESGKRGGGIDGGSSLFWLLLPGPSHLMPSSKDSLTHLLSDLALGPLSRQILLYSTICVVSSDAPTRCTSSNIFHPDFDDALVTLSAHLARPLRSVVELS